MIYYQLKNELWKLFGKKRTYMGFTMFVLAELAIILTFRYTNAQHMIQRGIERAGFTPDKYLSMLTISTVMIFMIAYTMMPLYVALVGGDFVSKEAEDGTLRMILSRPISRVRLLCVKWLAGFIFSGFLVFSLGFFGLLFSSLYFPTQGGLFFFVPDTVLAVHDAPEGIKHYAYAHLSMVFTASTIMSLAFMLSCFNVKPAAATILALSLTLIDRIMMELPYFHDMKECFLNYYLNSWVYMFSDHIPWWKMAQALCVMAGASLTFMVIGITAFQVRDIKS